MSLSLGWVAGDIGSSFPSPCNSSSFSRAKYYCLSSLVKLAQKLTGLAKIWARVVLGIWLIRCKLFFRPGPTSRVGYPFQLYLQQSQHTRTSPRKSSSTPPPSPSTSPSPSPSPSLETQKREKISSTPNKSLSEKNTIPRQVTHAAIHPD